MTKTELDAAIIIQARMSSVRLPGKTLVQLGGHRMLRQVVTRLSNASVSGPVIVATSVDPSDDFIESFCQASDVSCFRGSNEDVLGRFWQCAKPLEVNYIIRATADNPLVWEGAVEYLGGYIVREGCDYINFTKVMAVGLGLEMFTKEALCRAQAEAKLPHQREHVTPYFYENPDEFDCLWMAPPAELEADLRFTVDTKEDMELMREIYNRLYVPGSIIKSADAVELLRKNPELAAMNVHVDQKGLADKV